MTIQVYLSKFEKIIISDIDDELEYIGGPGIEVQLDESKFGKRKYHKGHKVDGVWIFGDVELTQEKSFLPKKLKIGKLLQQIINLSCPSIFNDSN